MESLLAIVRENSLAAVSAGVVIGLYLVGRIDGDDDEDHLPRFGNAEDEIAWHQARIVHLQAIRQSKMSKDETLAQLVNAVDALKSEIEGMKRHGIQ